MSPVLGRRILVVGHPGAGKTTLATRLRPLLGLPVFHLDRLFWKPGWKVTEPDKWQKIQNKLVAGKKWIIDGTYDSTLEIRLAAADTVIHLDFSTLRGTCGVLRRILSNHGQVRHDMGEGCPERLDWSFLVWTWTYRRRHRPGVIEALDRFKPSTRLITLTSPSEVRAFLAEM